LKSGRALYASRARLHGGPGRQRILGAFWTKATTTTTTTTTTTVLLVLLDFSALRNAFKRVGQDATILSVRLSVTQADLCQNG